MKIRGLLVAVSVLAVLFGLLYWSNRAEEARQSEPDPDAPPQILDLDQEDITRVSIRRAGHEPVVLEKDDTGDWALTEPEALRADQNTVDTLVGTLASLESNRLADEGAPDMDLHPFGLDAPQFEVEITSQDGAKYTLLVGDETPTGANFFAKTEDIPSIFTLSSWNKTSIEKTSWDLRDKRLLTFDATTLVRLELASQGQAFALGKNANGKWQIVDPSPLRANGTAVEQLISQLQDARISTEPTPEVNREATSAFAGAERVATARVTNATGTQELEVRRTAAGDYYAQSSEVEGIYEIAASVGEGLDKGLEDLRNKKLFDFGYSEPSRIEIIDDGESTVYEVADGKWMRNGRAVDSISLRSMMDNLRNLSAASFPDSGFTEPIFEATVVWDDNAERVLVSRDGDEYFARRENEPVVYELESSAVEDLLNSTRNIQDEPQEEAADAGE